MSKNTLIALGGGGLSAIASLAFMSGSPGALIFVYLAPLPLLTVGLGLGPLAVTVGGISGLLIAGLFGGAMTAGLFGMIHALPAWLVTRQALLQRPAPDGGMNWYPAGFVLSSLAALGAAFFTLTALITSSGEGGLEMAVSAYLDQVFTYMAPSLPVEERGHVVAALTSVFPGALVTSWVVMMAINGVLAQWILVRLGRNQRPSPALADLELPDWLSWILVGSAVIALLGSGAVEYIGRNTVMILAVPYFFLGLAVVHALARRVSSTGMILTAFYLILLVSGWAIFTVAGLGMAEHWLGLRRRLKGPDRG
ncbi:MAG: DUF2232 domain-containing protein [Proteobacteria bacterium]|nr:DUF2232 domain-containing protein [Pseudomonadota bacterium]